MDFPGCTENSHAPFKDQIDDETVMFDLDMSVDVLPDTPSKNDDGDSDTQKTRHEKESYIVQEILADFLKIKSFKRKYPDLTRRAMDAYERSWLQQEGIVPVVAQILLLQQDYPEVHVALTDLFRRRRFKATVESQKRQYEAARIERGEARAEAARRRALDSAADYNHRLVSERLSSRRCYWDLQTMQIHIPQRKYKLLEYPNFPGGAYPVAVIPGQFAEYFMSYTPEQLSYLPLSRILYPYPQRKHKNPPPLPATLQFGSIKPKISTPVVSSCDVGDQSSLGVDNSRSTDFLNHQTVNSIDGHRSVPTDGSFLASCGVSNSHASVSESETDKVNNSLLYRRFKTRVEMNTENPTCVVCGQLALNYIRCSECKLIGHSKCLDIPDSMLPGVKSYDWTCLECKRCMECNDSGQEDQMMFCDRCDRGYHAFCVGLGRIPNGKWECLLCESIPTPARKGRPRKNVPRDLDDLPWGYSPKGHDSYNIVQSGISNTEVPKRRRGRPPTKNRIISTLPPPLICPYIPNRTSFSSSRSDLSSPLPNFPSTPLPNKVIAAETDEPSAVQYPNSSIVNAKKELSCEDKIDISHEKNEDLTLATSNVTINENYTKICEPETQTSGLQTDLISSNNVEK
ncbi:unnamed protein product [Heterobilharzia americana]|nr:unnamed protein product [Heterobilharzia americana]